MTSIFSDHPVRMDGHRRAIVSGSAPSRGHELKIALTLNVLIEDALDLRVALKSRDLRDLSKHCSHGGTTCQLDPLWSDTATLHLEQKRLRTPGVPLACNSRARLDPTPKEPVYLIARRAPF